MFELLGRIVFRLRYLIVIVWAAAALGAALFAPSLSRVGSADQASFLPAGSESMLARTQLADAFPDEGSGGSATIAFSRPGGLTGADRAYIDTIVTWLKTGSPDALRSRIHGVIGVTDHPELAAQLASADGVVELLRVQLTAAAFQPIANEAAGLIRDHLFQTVPDGLQANVTGNVGIGKDYLESILAATDRTTLVTIALVVLVLLFIYRAPLAALVPLLTIGAAYLVASGILGQLAEAGWRVSSLIQTFVIVLVFGVGTDYTIFLISRFREESSRAPWAQAIVSTERRIGAVIAASGATVVVGLTSMAIGRFGMFQTTGPALAIAIVVTLVAGLTLTPALLAIFGRALFWPRHRPEDTALGEHGPFARLAGIIARWPLVVTVVVLVALAIPASAVVGARQDFDVLGDLPANADSKIGFQVVADHFDKGQLLPTIAVVSADGGDLTTPAALAGLRTMTDRLLATDGVRRVESVIAPSGDGTTPDAFRPSKQLQAMSSQLAMPTDLAAAMQQLADPAAAARLTSAVGYLDAVAAGFPDLAADPALVGARADFVRLQAAIGELRAGLGGPNAAALQGEIASLAMRLPGELTSVASTLAARPDDYLIPIGLSGDAGQAVEQAVAAYVSSGRDLTRLYVIAADDPYSPAAFATVGRIRDVMTESVGLVGSSATATVGGSTAEQADLKAAINDDSIRVSVLTIVGVFLVLVVLLRSLVAPLYLVGTVLLSYASTLGLTSWWFQDVLGQAGLNYFLPLMVFVLLVALGSDYNIFLMGRVREEAESRGTREGIRAASARTGAVITSAGLILAGTFLAMVAAPLTILVQVGVTVAVGVLIDTFVVRSLLVPAITTLLGDAAWWPFGRAGAAPSGPLAGAGRGPVRPAHDTAH